MAGAGFGAITETFVAADVPPPGAGFTAANERSVGAETSAAANATLTWVELVNVVARAVPLTWMTVAETNPVPVTVTTGEVASVTNDLGFTEVIVGAGLVTSRRVVEPELLVCDPFTATTSKSVPVDN
jgi:hypothetical protein